MAVPGVKFDNQKIRPRLVLGTMSRALEEVCKVATYGAHKYSDDNWLVVPDALNRYTDALLRHQLAMARGEEADPESGLPHAAHAAWNSLAILDLKLRSGVGAAGVPLVPNTTDNFDQPTFRMPVSHEAELLTFKPKAIMSEAQPVRNTHTHTQTYTGKMFDILNPRPDDVDIEDIARGLAGICRFKGSTLQHYSVAEHSVHVLDIVKRHSDNPAVHWWALMHDAAEAYTGDFPAPWKHLVTINGTPLAEIESRIDLAIRDALGSAIQPITWDEKDFVGRADLAMVWQEKREALPVNDVPWSNRFDNFRLQPKERVELQFLSRDKAYTKFMKAFDHLSQALAEQSTRSA